MITVVVGKEIEKLKGEFESVINGMNMVGEIPYNVYSELFDVGTDCIQKAYELGKSDLEKENAELKHIIATLRQEKDNVSMHAKAMEVVAKTRSDQLTKAKVVLRNVIDYLGQFCSDYPDCVIEAELFLKDSEVEK